MNGFILCSTNKHIGEQMQTLAEQKVGQLLSIKDVTPADFKDTRVIKAWDEMVTHVKRSELKGILTIRTEVQKLITEKLYEKEFLHPPTYLFATCVDPLNHETEQAGFTYYGQEVTLMQSLIFHKMALLGTTDLESIFWVSPNVRKELGVSDKRRYAAEFTQIDFESTKLDMESAIELISDVVRHVVNTLAEVHGGLIAKISGRRLKPIEGRLKRYDAEDEAIQRGVDVGGIEKLLAETEEHPFILTNLKREAYDRRDEVTGKYLNYDVIMPVTGEILSGAEREYTYDRLKLRMEELGYPLEYFEPILKLAKEEGLKPTAGAGFGVERFVRGLLLLDDIARVYPFKRVPEEAIIF